MNFPLLFGALIRMLKELDMVQFFYNVRLQHAVIRNQLVPKSRNDSARYFLSVGILHFFKWSCLDFSLETKRGPS